MEIYTAPTYSKNDGEFRFFSNFNEAKNYAFYALFNKVYECYPFVYENDEIYSTEMKVIEKLSGTYATIFIKKHSKIVSSRAVRIGTIKVD